LIPNSNAYAVLRDKSQEFLDFVVLSCTAIPTLKKQIQAAGVADITPDHFKGPPNPAQLLVYGTVYQEPLARMVVITLFSYFEAYVQGLFAEIVEFHGGATQFQATADERAKSFVANSSQSIVDAKRKLQEPAKGAKIESYKKQSAVLVKQGFRFPSELLAPYGVRNLIRKAKSKGSKAFEIPELLRDALCFPLSTRDDARLDSIRDTRNEIAHGKAGPITLVEALTIGKDLRNISAKVDKHAVEHFFVLEAFA
jgi:HEPN superfamily RiboL-PSP-like protein